MSKLQATPYLSKSGGGGASAPAPLRQVAQGGEWPGATFVATGTTNNMMITRKRIWIGSGDVTEMRVAVVGYFADGTGVGETALGNAQSRRIALEYAGQTVEFKWGGLAGPVNVPNNSNLLFSDPIYPAAFGASVFAHDTKCWIRDEVTVGSGQKFLSFTANGVNYSNDDTCATATAGSASLVTGTGALTTAGAYTLTVNQYQTPALIVGRTTTPQPSLGVWGDSIAVGVADLIGNGDPFGGAMRRALSQPSVTRHIAFAMIATAGTRIDQLMGSKRLAAIPYFVNHIDNYGLNDQSNGRTAAQVQGNITTLANAIIAAGGRYYRLFLTPRTTSTDNFITAANQTPVAGWEVGGNFRDPMNAWMTANVGGIITDTVNYLPYYQDATFADKWKSNGSSFPGWTTDGVHVKGNAVTDPVPTATAFIQALAA